MDAYLVPVLTALAGALATAAVLGAVRVGRWWAATGGGRDDGAAGGTLEAGVAAPGPAVPGDASDPHLSRLAHGSLGAALLIALTGIFLFAPAPPPGAKGFGLPAFLALIAAWAVGRSRR
jgi:hypothetical protein